MRPRRIGHYALGWHHVAKVCVAGGGHSSADTELLVTLKRSHAERCLANSGNGSGLACDLELGCGLSSEEIQQEFARRSDEPSRRLASPGSHSLVCPGPLELESHAA
jgi:hypothetical protein